MNSLPSDESLGYFRMSLRDTGLRQITELYECYTIHDYSVLNGVKTALTEFFADKPEAPIELPSTQCMIIKV